MRIEKVQPKEIGPSEAALWRGYQTEGLQSPYLTPEWAQIVGQARADARVCIIGGGKGFFGAQRASRFAALGLGAPISDYQAVLGEPGLEIAPAALCRALGVGRIDLTHVPEGNFALAGSVAGSDGSWIVETSGARELYEAGLKSRRSEFVRQTDKKLRKAMREHDVSFHANVRDTALFDTMLSWKCEQLRRSRQPAIWATPWVRNVLDQTFAAQSEHFSGGLFTMMAGEKLVAAAYFIRSGRTMHLWIIAHDSAYDACSPGVQLTRWAIGWAAEHGVAEIDFGPGDYQYKRQLATGQRAIQFGAATQLSFSGALRRGAYALRNQIERLPHASLAALPGKAMRKLDLHRALAA